MHIVLSDYDTWDDESETLPSFFFGTSTTQNFVTIIDTHLQNIVIPKENLLYCLHVCKQDMHYSFMRNKLRRELMQNTLN